MESDFNDLILNAINLNFKNHYCISTFLTQQFNFIATIVSKSEFSFVYDSTHFICDAHIFAGIPITTIEKTFESNLRFRQKYNRIIFLSENHSEIDEDEHLKKFSQNYDLEVIKIRTRQASEGNNKMEVEKGAFYRLEEISFVRNSRKIILWKPNRPKTNLQLFKHIWKPQIQREFRISLFHCPPHVIYDNETARYTGNEYRIANEITRDWKTKINHHEEAPNLWEEVRRDLKTNKSDLGLCAHFQHFALKDDLAVSYPFDVRCLTFLVPKPKLLPDVTFVFQPMTSTLWALIAISVFLFSFFAYVLFRCLKKGRKFSMVVLDVFGSIVTNAVVVKGVYERASLRQAFLFWNLTALLLVTAYNSGISSTLTYPRHTKPIKSIADMIRYNVRIHQPGQL